MNTNVCVQSFVALHCVLRNLRDFFRELMTTRTTTPSGSQKFLPLCIRYKIVDKDHIVTFCTAQQLPYRYMFAWPIIGSGRRGVVIW